MKKSYPPKPKSTTMMSLKYRPPVKEAPKRSHKNESLLPQEIQAKHATQYFKHMVLQASQVKIVTWRDPSMTCVKTPPQ